MSVRLAQLIGIDPAVIEALFSEQFKGKEKLLASNVQALHLGLDFAREHLAHEPVGLQVQPRDRVGERIFIDGNAAAALGCVYGGATVCAWYPITPSSSLAEAFQGYCSKMRHDPATGAANYAIVQAEDEIASIGIVTGAGWNGARAFTTTSGPGVSLMTEFIGLAYFAEIPVTIINVQRGGPSTGMPTRTQQADILSCAYASHGDTKHVLLLPEDPKECFDHAAAALDLADRLQTPVFVMTDLDIGMNQRLCEPFEWDDARRMDRGKVLSAAELEAGREFARYKDVDGDGIPWRTLPGTHASKGAYFTRGTTRDPYARYSEAGPDYVYNVKRLLQKFDTAASLVPAARDPHRQPQDAAGGDLLRLDQPGDGRGAWSCSPTAVSRSTPCACARFRSPTTWRSSLPRMNRSSSSSRTATPRCAPCCWPSCTPTPNRWCRSCTTTARRSRRVSSPARSRAICTPRS